MWAEWHLASDPFAYELKILCGSKERIYQILKRGGPLYSHIDGEACFLLGAPLYTGLLASILIVASIYWLAVHLCLDTHMNKIPGILGMSLVLVTVRFVCLFAFGFLQVVNKSHLWHYFAYLCQVLW